MGAAATLVPQERHVLGDQREGRRHQGATPRGAHRRLGRGRDGAPDELEPGEGVNERLGALVERDYQTWVESFAGTPGVEVVLTREVRYRRAPEYDHEYLSAVFGAHFDPAVADARIAAVVDVLGERGRAFIWTVWPSDGPPDLVDRLVAAGLETHDTSPLMSLDLSDQPDARPSPSGLVIREATSLDDLRRVAAFAAGSPGQSDDGPSRFALTFERLALEPAPRLRLFGGEVDGELVASSGLFTGSGVAGIYAVATADGHRGRGYGGALTHAAVAAGQAAGLETAVLMSSDLGIPVYVRLGFREVGRVTFLRWPGGAERPNSPDELVARTISGDTSAD